MKKVSILAIIMFCILYTCNVSASSVKYEVITGIQQRPLVFVNDEQPILVTVNGQQYFWNTLRSGNHIIKYDEQNQQAYDFLKEQTDCIWTGDYYMTRNSDYDSEGPKFKPHIKNPVEFYDKDFNLVHEQVFGEAPEYDYPEAIDYKDGKYYCKLYNGNTVSSEDMVNWNEELEYKWETFMGNVTYKDGKAAISDSDFYSVKSENAYARLYQTINLGEYVCYADNKGLHFSNDRLYWVDVYFDEELDNASCPKYYLYAYEYGNDIVIQTPLYRFMTPKKEVYDALEKLQEAPYIIYNNTLLKFEQSPVIENDRTLIPIRFLFEQMGATVDWDGETQTATISQNNTTVAFSINNTEADVNGQTVSMDVPARLINDKTMVPLRFLSEELGYTVDWDGEKRIITIE